MAHVLHSDQASKSRLRISGLNYYHKWIEHECFELTAEFLRAWTQVRAVQWAGLMDNPDIFEIVNL